VQSKLQNHFGLKKAANLGHATDSCVEMLNSELK